MLGDLLKCLDNLKLNIKLVPDQFDFKNRVIANAFMGVIIFLKQI